MNNLTTRKIVLGMLMTLVLAFSVQGTADAITQFTRGSGDLQMYAENQPFTVRFNVGVQSPRIKEGHKRIPSTDTGGTTVQSADRSKYYDDTDGSGYTIGTDTVLEYAEAHNYDEEAIDINVTGSAGALVTRIGNYDITPVANPADLTDGGTNATRLSSSITLTLSAASAGDVTITITDETDSADRPTNVNAATDLVFTVYIIENPTEVDADTLDLLGTVATNYLRGLDDFTDPDIGASVTGGSTHTNVKIKYDVVSGSGQVYVTTAGRIGPKGRSITTSSAATVQLDMNGTTNKVTVTVVGSNTYIAPEAAFFIYGLPSLEATQGSSGQRGAINGRLEDPLGIRVKDERGRTISGLDVTFTTTATGAAFIPIPGTKNTFDSNSPRTIDVETDNSGIANTYYQLGSSAGDETITAAAAGVTRSDLLKATAEDITSVPSIEIVSGNNQRTDINGDLDDPLVVKVTRRGSRVSGTDVTFTVNTGILSNTPSSGTTVSGVTVTDTTDGQGLASVTYLLVDHSDPVDVVASISGVAPTTYRRTVTFNINGGGSTGGGPTTTPTVTTPTTTLTVTPTAITGAPGSVQTLTINAGAGNSGVLVQIGQSDAFLEASGSAIVQPGLTNANGVTTASITLPSQTGSFGNLSVISQGYTTVLVPVTVGTATPTTTTTPATLTADKTSINGAPGSVQRIIATARNTAGDLVEGVPVTFSIVGFATRTQNTDVFGTAAWNFTLPTTVGPYTLNITATDYQSATVSITVDGAVPVPTTGLRLLVTDGNNQSGAPGSRLADPLIVTVVNNVGQAVANRVVLFSVTSGGGRVSPASAVTNASGQAQTLLTLGRIAGTNTVVASLNGVSVTFTATAETAPALLEVYDGNNQRGTPNVELAEPLVVLITDDDGDAVENVRVTFRITSGSARLSQRGTGRASTDNTDNDGMAEATLTPTGAGPITVRASASGLDSVTFTVTTGPPPASIVKVSGDNQAGNPGSALANPLVVEVQDAEGGAVDGVMVRFEVTAGGGTLSAETATTNAQGRAQTRLTLGSEREINSVRASVTGLDAVTFNTSVDAVIHVAASNRPVMYWIDGGALYHLAGAKAARIAASANDVAVDMTDGKIYWIEATSNRTGRVHSANVDGTGATVVKELTSVPMGLAHDSASDKLYLTNSWGKIQRMNIDGTQFESNFIVGLGAPMDIAVSSGRVYWTEAGGNVQYSNVDGTKVVSNIATGTGALSGIAAGSNKVYWTEQTGNISGKIRSANLDGTGAADLFTLTAVPAGIAVDAAAGKVYWANGWGKIQRRDLSGAKFQDLVTGLMAPGAVAIGGANVATPTETPTQQPPTTAKSQYDVNNDGTVDNVDAALVAGASGTNNRAYDVNGDGTVNFLDLLLVFDNRDAGAAGAPTVARTRLTAIQVDRIQEQIDLLLATNDRSPGALYTLQYLQSLIAAARPGKTQLLANYPNPFNPETWIPYELATDTNVKLTIYDAQGVVVRTLELGHQSAGYYTSRDRAAYWDGRNSFGELVASGLYFYQLETDETSSMRKMVILK